MPGLGADETRYTFRSQDYDDELHVVQFSGSEGISELFQFGIELSALDSDIDLDVIVGRPAQLEIEHEDGVRRIHGIVSRFEQSVGDGLFTPYYAELVPTVWFLTQRYQSRIFQGETVEGIIHKVLTDAGISSDAFRINLQGRGTIRDYCVQYRETDWNFIARLMEEEGIFFFFDHSDDRDVLIMANGSGVHGPIAGDSTVVYRDASGTVEDEAYIYDFRYSQQVRPGKVALRDYDFTMPRVDMTREASAARDTTLEVYDYPGLYSEDRLGNELVRIRLEAAQARRLVGEAQSVCRRMIAGSKFTLADCPNESLNQDYLIIWVHHEGTQPHPEDDGGRGYRYNNHVRCIPATVPFRPVRKTPKPVVEGSQTAVVTGPSGEEIHVDAHGRVKVKFHWDRQGKEDETSSCWIRVSQLWAGAGWGAMFIPRIGHEVIVSFLEGDPDRPIITGRVYNGNNVPPYPLDAEKTKSTIKSESSKGRSGFNEIRFEDLAGSEEIYQHAQKNLTIKTENDKSQDTGHDETLTIGNDRTKNVGNDETTTVGNNRTETVGKNETISIGGNRQEQVGGNETIFIGGSRSESIDGSESVSISGEHAFSVDANSATSIGGDRTVVVKKNETLSVTGKKTDAIKQDLSQTVGGEWKVEAAQNIAISTDKGHSLKATGSILISSDKDITLTCGKARIVLKKDGKISIQGADISVKGSGKIKIKGSKIAQN